MNLSNVLNIFRCLGIRWVLYRILYFYQIRSGYLERKMLVREWDDIPDSIENSYALDFILCPQAANIQEKLLQIDNLKERCAQNVIEDADSILQGEFKLFSYHKKCLGIFPNWHKNPFTHEVAPSNIHWSKLSDFEYGDIKTIWELSRFPWAFTLARAYARTKDERYAERFWLLFENWMIENPPNIGINWKCGQEAAFRLIATAFARRVFSHANATTPERLEHWRKFILVTGERISGNIKYALSQDNNHGISECVGLLTVARILPDAEKSAEWRNLALKNLCKQLDALVYIDGSFSQHSFVYHRVLLHDLSWYLAMEKSKKHNFSDTVLSSIKKAKKFIQEFVDPETGDVPLCGSNDGSNILPLSESDYLDFRPVIQMVAALSDSNMVFQHGPWDESAFWLDNGGKAIYIENRNFDQATQFHADVGGWHIIRGKNTRLFFHAPPKFMHRPSQADLLHVDIWWSGFAITRDPGTYSYNTNDCFSGMKETCVHNTVEVDERDQMYKVNRFLYLPWACSKISYDDSKGEIKGTHYGYEKDGVLHTRCIKYDGHEGWLIEDKMSLTKKKEKPHIFKLHWLLFDRPYHFDSDKNHLILEILKSIYHVQVKTNNIITRSTVVRADNYSHRGWWSPYYYHVEPALSMVIELVAAEDVSFKTYFSPYEMKSNTY